jgi:uncharacterized membrane protein YkvA (DUF1232 family)
VNEEHVARSTSSQQPSDEEMAKQSEKRSEHRRRGPIGMKRALGLLAFAPIASRAPVYVRLMWELVSDERMPAGRKALLGGALGYLVVGRDLVPDDIPIIGGLDDVVVVLLAIDLFLEGVPSELLEEKLDALGIDRRAFEDDMARIRRFVPGPVRRGIRRLPGATDAAIGAVRRSGVGPRVRNWINKEESLA